MTPDMNLPNYCSHRFLIADDKQFLRGLIHSMLVRCRAGDIKHAKNGRAAIDILTDGGDGIDCVLCDWNMEPDNGLELLRSVRAGLVENTPRDLCFIMLTGYADETVVKAAKELDVSGYVVKPVSLDKLIRAIDGALAKPVALKTRETYQAKPTLELPNAELMAGKRIPPWVLLSQMRDKTKEVVSKRLDELRAERETTSTESPTKHRLVINEKNLPLDEIDPGKVLAENIYSEGGRLLLARGTALDERGLKRLRELSVISSISIHLRVGDYGD